MYRSAEQIQRDHVRTLDRHRKEAAQRAKAHAVPQEPKVQGINPYAMYVWRRGMWMLVAFVRQKPSVKRMARWRTKYRIKDSEVVRYRTLWDAQRLGPPTDDPKANSRLVRSVRRTRDLKVVREAIRVSVKVRGTPDMPMCDKKACRLKGTWLVGYVSTRSYTKQVVSRCTKHAWSDAHLPSTASQIVRVQRSSIN